MRCVSQRAIGPVAFAHVPALIRDGGEQGLRGGPRAAVQKSYRAYRRFSAHRLKLWGPAPMGVILAALPPSMRERKDRSRWQLSLTPSASPVR